jgi:hypothetical protein
MLAPRNGLWVPRQLTKEQEEMHRTCLSGSFMPALMNGDDAGVLRQWQLMTGHPDYLPLDLSDDWRAQHGSCTEALNLYWFYRKQGPISRVGDIVHSFDFDWAAVTLDAWYDRLHCPVECKDTAPANPFETRPPLELVAERYQPQLQWTMFVTDAAQCALSVSIYGAEPVVEFVPRDNEYIGKLLLRAKLFMKSVWDRTPPVTLPAVPAPGLRELAYDMSEIPLWHRHAAQWLQCRGAAESARESEKVLKSLVPGDAKKAFGCGIAITVDRADRKHLREEP